MSHRAPIDYQPDKPGPKAEKLEPSVRAALEAIEEAINRGKGKPLDELGRELPDPRPEAPPVGWFKQPTMVEHIRNLVRSELLRREADAEDIDTFEEGDDFDVDDDQDDPRTPYEAVFDPPAPTLPETPSTAAGGPPNPPETQSGEPSSPEKAPASPVPTPASGSGAQP